TIDSGVGFGDAAPFVLEVAPILLQTLAARARERIGGGVADEVRPTKRPIISLALLPQGHVRFDGFLLDHPGHHLSRAISSVAYQPFREGAEPALPAIPHHLYRGD